MESTKLDAPDGIQACLGWAPGSEPGERIREIAKTILSEQLEIDAAFVNVDREVPKQFGHHTGLVATVDGREVPLAVRTASYRTASVVAVSAPGVLVGLDIRDHQPDEATLHEIRGHSHLWGDSLWEQASNEKLLMHWSRVQAVRQADPRGVSIRPEQVRLDPPFAKAWTPDRKAEFRLVDLSRSGFIITLAYGGSATD
jgi:hypothetical protein